MTHRGSAQGDPFRLRPLQQGGHRQTEITNRCTFANTAVVERRVREALTEKRIFYLEESMSTTTKYRAVQRTPRTMVLACILACAATLTACADGGRITESESQQGVRSFTRDELARRMQRSTGLSSEALHLSAEAVIRKYENTLGAKPSGAMAAGRATSSSDGSEIFAAIEAVLARNPNFANLQPSDVARISADLGGLSQPEVVANLALIRELYDSKIRHEVYMATVAGAPAGAMEGPRLSLSSQWDQLNEQEKNLLIGWPWLAPGTRQAKLDATAYAASYWGPLGDGHRGNAYKHALWNALIPKHTGVHFSSVQAALDWAKMFTDAHEYGHRMPDDSRHFHMDLHNNHVGREYLRSVAWMHKNWKGTEVAAPSVAAIADGLRSRAEAATKFTSTQQLPHLRSSLVYFKLGTPVHRLYHPGIPDHLYTTSAGEGTNAGWRTEANGYFHVAPNTDEYSGYVPLYRCWVSGRHYVSLDAGCEQNVRAEGVLGRVSMTQRAGTVPLYRLRHPVSRDVLSTWSASERDQAIQRYGYKLQTTTGFVWRKE